MSFTDIGIPQSGPGLRADVLVARSKMSSAILACLIAPEASKVL